MKRVLLTLGLLATVTMAGNKIGVDTVYSKDNHKDFVEVIKLVSTGNNPEYKDFIRSGACGLTTLEYELYKGSNSDEVCSNIVKTLAETPIEETLKPATVMDLVFRRVFGIQGYKVVKHSLLTNDVKISKEEKMAFVYGMINAENVKLLNKVNDIEFDDVVRKITEIYLSHKVSFIDMVVNSYNRGSRRTKPKVFRKMLDNTFNDINTEVKKLLTGSRPSN